MELQAAIERFPPVVKAVTKQFEPGLTAGEWYLRYKCPNCQTMHVLFRDLTRGSGLVRATYLIECPTCRAREAYEGQDLERYHHSDNTQAQLIDREPQSQRAAHHK